MASGVLFSESFLWANAVGDLATAGSGKWSSRASNGGSWSFQTNPYGRGYRFTSNNVSNTVSNEFRKDFTVTTYNEFTVGFAFQALANPTLLQLVKFYDGATLQMDIVLNNDGSISARRNGTVILGPSTRLFPDNSGWYYFWFRCKIDPSGGTVKLIGTGPGFAGETILSGTGLNTRASANSRVTAVAFYGASNNSGVTAEWASIVIIDCAVNPVDKLSNECRVDYLGPDGDGFYTAWTPSTGTTRYTTIDEKPPNGDTDYSEAAAVNDQMSVTLSDPSVVSGTIHTVVPYHVSRKTDAGDGSMAVGLRQNSVDALGADTPLSTGYAGHYMAGARDTAPDGSAWDYTKLGSTELLFKRTL
jgi:hypothetical protein